MENNEKKDYKEERFEFTIFVNDFIICSRNFRIFNYIENSMNTLEFKETVDNIVKMIDDDLKSKSRVYTWYNYDPNYQNENDEFNRPLIDPWKCTFKIVIYDNKKEVISRIWDGYAYPKQIRERVDLGNKYVKVYNESGEPFLYEKEAFFTANEGRLTFEQELLKAMIMDKQDVLLAITKAICKACSPSREELKETGYFDIRESSKYLSKYTTAGVYDTTEPILDEDGDVISYKKVGPSKRYEYNIKQSNKRLENSWAKALSAKTKKYFKNLY